MRIAGLMAFALVTAGTAEAQTPPDAAKLKTVETTVPPQAWYPDGYYDVRIAAEGQIAERPRKTDEIVFDFEDGLGKRYDIIDCGAEEIQADGDMTVARYGYIALDISRLRSEFAMLGYPASVYSEPLAAYERARIEEAARLTERQVQIAAGIVMPAEDEPEPPDVGDYESSPDFKFITAIEANRKRLAPKLPMIVLEGGCGAGEGSPIIVRTSPPGGEVLLINAFGFKVCTRKKPDPWDRFACKWNEIETGTQTRLSGRYVYQVKWPDGIIRKGTRDIMPNFEDEETPVTVTFKKTGS